MNEDNQCDDDETTKGEDGKTSETMHNNNREQVIQPTYKQL